MSSNHKTNASKGFHHLALRVKDIVKSRKFYTEILGFKEKISFPHPWDKSIKEILMLDIGDGNYLEVFSNAPDDIVPEGAYFHVAFRTDDVIGIYNKAKSSGAEIIMEPTDINLECDIPTVMRATFFRGPDGEQIEFCQIISGVEL